MVKRGKFIVIDGVDGCGKGTQIKLLKKDFPEIVFTREPGGTPVAEQIRDLLLCVIDEKSEERTPLSDFLLFWAAREINVKNLIMPALNRGQMVVSDRFDSSTYAFQLFGEEYNSLLDLFLTMRQSVIENCEPHLYIILDLLPEVSLKRMADEYAQKETRFDLKPLAYHERVRKGFKDFARISPCIFIDANRSVDEVYADVKRTFLSL